jgi:haloalkane dehalogenase
MDVIVNGVRLQYIESGSGYPVICMHGNGLNRDLWRHIMPELSNKYRAIVYELRGMGKSETPGKPGLTIKIEDHAKDLEGFMNALNIRETALVAHALGGFVSMQFAIEHPERVRAMIVACTTAKMEGRTLEGAPKWAEIIEKEGVEPLLDKTMAIGIWLLLILQWVTPQISGESFITI